MKFQVPKIFDRIRTWANSILADAKIKIGQKILDRIYGAIVTVLFVLIGLLLGYPKFEKWYEGYSERKTNPPIEVFYEGFITEYNNTQKQLVGVTIKIDGIEGIMATSNEEGYFIFSREETQGEHLFNFRLIKEGYETQKFPKIPSPIMEGDTTTQYWQMPRKDSLNTNFTTK